MQLLLSVQQIRCTSFDFRSHAVNFVRFEKVYMLGAQIFVVYGTITNENVYFSSVSVILQESTRMPVR